MLADQEAPATGPDPEEEPGRAEVAVGDPEVAGLGPGQHLIDLYRQNPVSVRVRIIDPGFASRGKVDRSKEVWKYLDSLPDEVQSDLSALILLTPEETRTSIANFEFDDPILSRS